MSTEALTVNVPSEATGPEAPATRPAAESGGEDSRKYGDGSFSSVEELEQAYAALKQEKEKPAEESTPETDAAPEQDASRAEADKTLQGKGLDITSFEQEWNQNGELSEDSYKALEKSGIPKSMVDSYIAGQNALVQAFVGEVHQIAGGEAEYSAMTEWAKANMNPQEVNAFNAIMNKGNREEIKLAVTGMLTRYRDTEGYTPTLVSGKASAGAGVRDAFESTAQVTAAMRDKRYGKDAAYTKAVEEKMRRSTIFG